MFVLFNVFAVTVPPVAENVTVSGTVGTVLSNVTLPPPSVTAITSTPGFVAISVKLIVKGTAPVESPPTIV